MPYTDGLLQADHAGMRHIILWVYKPDSMITARTSDSNLQNKCFRHLLCRFGAVESVRLRSLPLKEGLKMPRKAAIASGNVDAERAPAHAYIVFGNRASSVYALQLNMSEAGLQAPQHLLTMTASCTFRIPAY